MKFTYSKDVRARVLKSFIGSRERCAQRMKPFLRFFKVCGMFANEITEGPLKRCSWPCYGICVFWICVYVAFACCLLYYFTKVKYINVRLMTDVLKHLTAYINLSVNVIVAYSSQDRFVKFFDRLESYDDEVARMRNARRDNLWTPWISVFSIIVISLLLASVMLVERSTNILYFVTLSDVCTSIMHICGTVEKYLLLRLLLARFKHLNERIVPKVSWDEKRPGAIGMLNVRTLQSMLYDAQEAFNDTYRNAMLIWFASLMLHVVANIRIFRERIPLIASAFVVPQILQVLVLCAICHYTAEEANKIVLILSENMCALVGAARQTTAKLGVYVYLLHNRVAFDAAGFFIIDFTLFACIIAAITTYFIILI